MDKKIKIVYLITGLKTGGAETVLARLVSNLDKERFTPIVVSIIPIAEIGIKIKQQGIRVESLGAYSKFNPLVFLRLFILLKKERPDVLHCFLFHAILLGRLAGRISSVPTIISSIRTENFGGRMREKLLALTDAFSSVTTIVSQKAADKMVRNGVVPSEKLKVIYNGFDPEGVAQVRKTNREQLRADLKIEPGSPLLVAVGRLDEAKGYPVLIEAIGEIKKVHPSVQLLILGSGEMLERLTIEINNRVLDENIRLLGRKENVYEYLRCADIFVLASLWEGHPNVVLEAMACGAPVVATNVGGVPEIILDGETGFLVESNNARALADKIIQVSALTDEARKTIVDRAYKKIENNFSLGEMMEEYEQLYERRW
ncbi:MAG: glycosyl transferase group 1 [uncultured bacterium]|uniref:Glycosyl transferase group 1 n=1 Tax=Candidatus Wolfebacteria bacterium GW2011_GWE2_44_13 TaxID=1619017 RepID=A0A0G1H9T7_9BACT|nr:MAG: glycosyl transferase group 1 [uncultured bacterium]KKT43545.1 MAG: Glycosyl transferase group 1 [Candidatus Wolfebacteria bacterium GW2011_GWE2_44_13]